MMRTVRSAPAERIWACPAGPPPMWSSSSWKRTHEGGAACPERIRRSPISPECASQLHMRSALSEVPALSSSDLPRMKTSVATPPSCAHGWRASRARFSRCHACSMPDAAPETSHGVPSVRKARLRTASPSSCLTSRMVESYFRLCSRIRPSKRPTATTSSAGDCSSAVTGLSQPRSNSCTRARERRFQSCILPLGAPNSTLLRYVAGCKMAVGVKPACSLHRTEPSGSCHATTRPFVHTEMRVEPIVRRWRTGASCSPDRAVSCSSRRYT
eukprot:scaffold130306_cov30-Tisochrysis_lutea.AAC.4